MKRLRDSFLPLSVLLACGMLLVSSATTAPASPRVGLIAGPGSTPWPLFRHDQPHTGRSDYAGTPGAGVRWSYTTGGVIMSSPALGADGTIYFGSMDGYLYAVDPSGILKWKFATTTSGTQKGIVASPAVGYDGTIFVGARNGNLYAVDPDSGLEKWHYTTGGVIMSSCVIGEDGSIYFGSDDTYVYSLSYDGAFNWSYVTEGRVTSTPALDSGGTLYVGSWDGSLYALYSSTGYIKWQYATGDMIISSPTVSADEQWVFVGSYDGKLYGLNAATGAFKWSFWYNDDPHQLVSSSALGSDGTIYMGCLNGMIFAFDPTNIKLVWDYNVGSPIISSPAVDSNGVVYAAAQNGTVYALKGTSGSVTLLWSQTTAGGSGSLSDGVQSSPAIGEDGTIYIGAADKKLYAISQMYTLTTMASPSTAGTVTLTPSGGTYEPGTTVQLSANAGTDYVFDHWSGDLTGSSNPANIVMDGNKSVTAVFKKVQYTLTTAVSPTGAGSVTLTPSGGVYDVGTTVQVKANAATGYVFDHWTGNLTGSTNPANIVMDGNKSVTAVFKKVQYTLTTAVSPTGAGTVTLTPSGGVYDVGTTVQVKASATTGYVFDHWTGDLTGSSNPANIVMAGNKSVTAVFKKVQYTLTTAVSPTGAGSVTLTPSGGVYDVGTTVQVKASATTGYVFDHWSGDLTGSANPASIVMAGNKSVTAVFKKVQYTLTTAVSPTGAGSVTLTPSGGVYDVGTTVQVKASATTGYVFDHWTGDLTGSTNPTSIVMAGNKSVTAVFKKVQYTLTTAVSPTGAGSVTLTPSGGVYDAGTTVQVKASAATGYVFDHWRGDLTGSTNPTSIVMAGNKSVTAVFKKVQYTLTTAVSPTGAGSVTLTPSGGVYAVGTTVQVKASAATGYVFDHWSGDLTGSTNPTSIVMNGNKSVTALFTTLDTVSIQVPAAPSEERSNGYRMIGIPLMSASGASRDVFATVSPFFGGVADPYKWALYKPNGTTLINKKGMDTVGYGKGWWIISTKAKTMEISGKPLTTDFRMKVSKGQQMIACPFSDMKVSWASVVADPANESLLLGAKLHYFKNGEYVISKTMEPGKAYWASVGSSGGGTLLIRRSALTAGEGAGVAAASDAELEQSPPPLAPGSRLTVLSPPSGGQLKGGSAYGIRWSSSGISPEGFTSRVSIGVSMDGGKTFSLVAEGVPNTGAYLWSVPEGTARGHCRIRVTSDLYPKLTGTTEKEFSITKH